MPFVFYDTETTGLDTTFDQILQFAAVKTNHDLEIEDQERDVINLRCRRLPHVVPTPGALSVTQIPPELLDTANLSHYEMMGEVAAKLDEWSPAAFVGYNSIKFDETLLRQAFYQNLFPIYLTNTNSNYRVDIMRIVQAAAVYAPDKIEFPVNDRGQPIYKLGPVARANGISFSEEEAHDALNDVNATLGLARFLQDNVPEVWGVMLNNALKSVVNNFVEQNEVFCLTNFFGVGPYSEIVTAVGRNAEDKNEIAVFNLGNNPEDFFGLDDDELLAVLGQSPKIIRTVRVNAQPIIMPLAMKPEEIKGQRLDDETYHNYATLIQQNEEFQNQVSETLPRRFEDKAPSPYVEKRMYDNFIEDEDKDLCVHFHEVPWSSRVELCEQFSDERLKELGMRLIFVEHPEVLSTANRARLEQWVNHRVATEEDVPWSTVPKASIELADIQRAATAEAMPQLDAIKDYLVALASQHESG